MLRKLDRNNVRDDLGTLSREPGRDGIALESVSPEIPSAANENAPRKNVRLRWRRHVAQLRSRRLVRRRSAGHGDIRGPAEPGHQPVVYLANQDYHRRRLAPHPVDISFAGR